MAALLIPLLLLSIAQAFKCTDRTRVEVLYFSSESPIVRTIQDDPEIIAGANVVQQHFAFVEEHTTSALAGFTSREGLSSLCSAPDAASWARNIQAANCQHGWTLPGSDCVSDIGGVELNGNTGPYSVKQLYDAHDRFATAFQRNLPRIRDNTLRDTDFIKDFSVVADTHSFIKFEERSDVQCNLHVAVGFRISPDAKFALGIQFHNASRSTFLPRGARARFLEYATVENGKLVGVPAILPIGRDERGRKMFVSNATTASAFDLVAGRKVIAFSQLKFSDVPSIAEALGIAERSLQQSANTMLPSSFAILLLPVTLAFVPVAVLTHISTSQMLVYTVMTDVLTVLPLMIKGFELIAIGRSQFYSVFVRMGSAYTRTGKKPPAATAESWAAKCWPTGNLEHVGIAFVVVAVFALVFGVSLEFGSFIWVRRRAYQVWKQNNQKSLEYCGIKYTSDTISED